MGVAISDIIPKEPIDLDTLNNKIIAIDAHNFLYQFLTSLRQPDGSYLTNSKGQVTSHLLGLFNRTATLMQKGIKCVFVFDGEPPELKKQERERRRALKEQAQVYFDQAKEDENQADMKKYASRTTKLTSEMIEDAKRLIKAMGLPIIQAPSEGEAQAAYMQQRGDVDYVASQDADALLFGAKSVIKNLSIAGKRKKTGKLAYTTILPELIKLDATLNELGIDQKKLIYLSIFTGCDFAIGGIKGIGPKKALKLVKEHDEFDTIAQELEWSFEYPPSTVYKTFTQIPIQREYTLTYKPINEQELLQITIDEFEFSKDRVQTTLKKIQKANQQLEQKGLGDFF
ncbi:MAG: flap endonuclease-1 [Candidatus Woesearchaeota archaeon]